MATVYLGLGTNLGDKEYHLRSVVHEITKRIGDIVILSAFYVTPPWGFNSKHFFLNAVCAVRTSLSPQALLGTIQEIERLMGREEKSIDGRYTDRPIDVDILLYGRLIMKEGYLEIPHPLMTKRRFVMEPLVEIAPDAIHPVFHRSIRDLWQELVSASF